MTTPEGVTPLPWRIIHVPIGLSGNVAVVGTSTEDDKDYIVAGSGVGRTKADAAYIVKAANLAPQLAEALEAIEWQSHGRFDTYCPDCRESSHTADCKLAAALAAWKAQS